MEVPMIGSSCGRTRLWRDCLVAGFWAALIWPQAGRASDPIVDLAAVRAKLAESRLQKLGEEDLRRQVHDVPEVGLTPAHLTALLQAYPMSFAMSAKQAGTVDFDPKPLVQICPQAAFLPLRKGAASRLEPAAATTLEQLSRKLRLFIELGAPKGLDNKRDDSVGLETILRREKRGPRPEWLRAEAIPTLQQMLMHEDTPVRRLLIELLEEIPGPAASVALAQRAVFELAPELRAAAVEALAVRPVSEYRQALLDGFRYPWPPIAEHAAEALTALGDKKAVPSLVTLLREVDPRDAVGPEPDQRYIRHLIKTNHVTNCLLCHPPAISFGDPVSRAVPGIFWQVPTTMSEAQAAKLGGSLSGSGGGKYGGGSGGSGGSSGGSGGDMRFSGGDVAGAVAGAAGLTFVRNGNRVSLVPKQTSRKVRILRLPVMIRAD